MNKNFALFLKTPFTFLAIFALGFISLCLFNLYTQHDTLQKDFIKSGTSLKTDILTDLVSINATLSSAAHLLSNKTLQKTYETLEIISQKATLPGLFATGHCAEVPNKQAHAYFKTLRQKGYNNLFFSNSSLTPQITKVINQHLIIDHVFPFLPAQLQLLGKDLMTLPAMPPLNNAIHHSKRLNQRVIKLNHKPYLMIFWQKLNDEPHQRFFYIFDLRSEILSEAHKRPLLNHANIKIQYNLSTNESLQPLPKSNSFIKSLFILSQHFVLQPYGQLIKVNIHTQLNKSDFNWKQAILVGTFGGVILTLIAYLVLLAKNFLVRLTRQNIRQQELLNKAHQAIILTDTQGCIQSWNPEAVQMFGFRFSEVEGHFIQDILFEHAPEEIQAPLKQFQLHKLPSKISLPLQSKIGNILDCEMNISHIQVRDASEYFFFIEDISHEKQTEHKMTQLAYFDPLTQLENKTFFTQQVNQILTDADIRPHQGALLFIDLDGFKKVNDTLGHTLGDELLKVVAKRFYGTIRTQENDTHLGRFGGDEFVFYLPNLSADAVAKTALRLLEQAKKPIIIQNHPIEISASIGIAFYPENGDNLDALMQHADTAMYEAKHAGKNTFSIYRQEMEAILAKHVQIEENLRLAIKNDELELYYQPQVSTQTKQIIGVEALIRWRSSKLGFVPPNEFISVAEESGLINDIGDWVAQKAIRQLKKWENTPLDQLRIAINVSANQLNSINFSQRLNDWLMREQIAPSKLEIELTERAVMENAQDNINVFNDIRANGLSLSVDDFGTGYSSLSYLKRFPLNILKVDKSFVDGLPGDEDDVAISSTIIQLAHNLRMNVVAEGVETKEQLDFLTRIGCDLIQGYYYSKPLPPTEFMAWASDYEKTRLSDETTL